MKKNIRKLVTAGIIAALLSGQTAFAAEVTGDTEASAQVGQVNEETLPGDEATEEEVTEVPDNTPGNVTQEETAPEMAEESMEDQMQSDPSKEVQTESVLPEAKEQESEHVYKLQYRVHVQTYGWQDWKSDGEIAGSTGQAKRIEAIQICLTGKYADKYDIYYRVHSQTYGWLDWAKNGQKAGSLGYAKRLEALEICLVE